MSTAWFTPRELAHTRRLRVSTVLMWVRTGELEAINLAADRLMPPRFKISAEALARFDAARSNRAASSAPPRRASARKAIPVNTYFE